MRSGDSSIYMTIPQDIQPLSRSVLSAGIGGNFLLSMLPLVKLYRKLSRSCNRGGPSTSCSIMTDCCIPPSILSICVGGDGVRLRPVQFLLCRVCVGPLIVVDVLPWLGVRSKISKLRRYPRRLGLRALSPIDSDTLRLDEGGDASPMRQRMVCRSGRNVAMLPAVIPIPGSTVLQTATSIVASIDDQHKRCCAVYQPH